jgi:phage shock protein PspC (stress-responsive transcriptional regulator)
MKKIININLSGRVIPIEDSAYEKLQAYIESLRRYFANEEGRDEIINDIESRVAELMSEKIRKGAAAITDDDINEIISSMGRVEDFEAVDKEHAESASTTQAQAGPKEEYTEAPKQSKGRLYRDTNDKFIGGVCSGIAAYMNVDPAIVRILFAIITFGGFGLGFLAYIILWIILPPRDLEGYMGKRLYRNPDDRVIGGVAGGLAAYFNKSARIIRLIFAAPILLSILIRVINRMTWDNDFDVAWNIGFGSISGTFILVYVILWMILPEANTTYEKMEMRGEKVDINRIRQNVKEGMDSMKDKVKGWKGEVKESAQNLSNKAKEFANTRGKEFAAEVKETTRRTGGGLGHAIGVIFKVFFLFIAGTIAFALFVSLIAILFGGVAWWPINNFLWTSQWQQALAWGTLIFFLIVPLVGFITWVIRRILRTKSKNNYLGWIFGGLWTIGWIAMVFFVASIVRDFREYEHTDTALTVNQPAGGKLIIAVSQPELENTGSFGWMNDGDQGWDLSDDTLKIAAVKFNVRASTDQLYRVTVKRYSFGKTTQEALGRADKIKFEVVSTDSVLDLANGYAIGRESKFRGQYVEVEIQVPVGKKIRFDESVPNKLNNLNIEVKRSFRRNRISGVRIDTDERGFHYRPGVDYTMGVDGELKDSSGNSLNPPVRNDYRYEGTDSNTNEKPGRKETIDERKKRWEEEGKKIKEEEQKQTKPISAISETIQSKSDEGSMASGPSPVSAITQWF